jgi:hypothetical protein
MSCTRCCGRWRRKRDNVDHLFLRSDPDGDRPAPSSAGEDQPGDAVRSVASGADAAAGSGEHWTRIRTNNVIERLNREIRRRTRVVGTFPDGNSALMLVCARLRHVAGTQWGCKKYMNMKHLEAAMDDASIAG